MSTSGHQQFRYTQTPSKVLHLRNLPWECNEEELVELCKPFGKIVNTKCNVGANRNQAFVEFVDLNQAVNMVAYYASSPEPAQIRGKAVYIQYSNRHEIVNNKSPGDVPGNVLLATIEGVEAGDISIEVIHLDVGQLATFGHSLWSFYSLLLEIIWIYCYVTALKVYLLAVVQVFSAFGFVHKIATFEKAAGFQALIQYSDVQTATTARDSLDGRSIPRYLLPSHVNECYLRISYSAHTDLSIKFQSHRSRTFWHNLISRFCHLGFSEAQQLNTNPALGPDGKKKELESNVLLASMENMQYTVTVDVLHTVFSAFGTVQKIAIFEKNGGTQALIQYPDMATASIAKEALEGHCIYDGGYCKLHLSFSRHTDLNVKAYSDKSRDYTIPLSLAMQQPVDPSAPTTGPSYVSSQAYPLAPNAYAAAPFNSTGVHHLQPPYYGS
ncbi:polypyrimidine tract-binding protein-like [Striga asiatica]|uniref:Polypyrimidine tract-binding protein-like n=1 Tax=Striga asiatica TaxID=4170 RepID=A0A5A7QLR2_STRAF|nr:polypyrimidine tract-binding protein-like [Striga asiatica]